jgi:hypothetical protein
MLSLPSGKGGKSSCVLVGTAHLVGVGVGDGLQEARMVFPGLLGEDR